MAKKVDSKFRTGGSETIGHGGKSNSDLTHPCDKPDYKKVIGVMPSDAGEFDQHHGNAGAESGDHYGSSKE